MLAANVIGKGGNCGNGCGGNGGSGDDGAFRSVSEVMFKILYVKSSILNINLDLPVFVEDRQLTVLAAHIVTTMMRLMNAQRWRGQATVVAKAEAVQGQTTINQKVAAKMFKILL